jgi:hypothetical protein
MKLSKDQTQKIILGAMMFCGIIYAYFEFLLGPQSTARAAALKEAEALTPKIDAARAQIAKAKAIEAREPATVTLLDQVKAMVPQGAPIAWVPTKLGDLFKSEGVERVSVRMVNELAEKELAGFSKFSWAVEIPSVEFITLGSALSGLENSEPLMEITTLEIEAARENVQFQRAILTLNNIVRL